MKILLVSFYNTEAYGLRLLHSKLIKDGVDAYMMFFKTVGQNFLGEDYEFAIKQRFNDIKNEVSNKEIDLFINFIIEFKPDLVAFSLFSSNFHLYKRIYHKIKNINEIKIVIGGWQPTLNPHESILYTDYLCIGEGSMALSELVYNLSKGLPTDKIGNIWVNNNNTITKNKVSPLTDYIVSNPIPLFDNKYSFLIDNNDILSKEPYFDNTRYGTFINYGCPHYCTYCSNNYMVKHLYGNPWRKSRNRNIEDVICELRLVKRKLKNVNRINFYDEVFMSKMDFLKEFSIIFKKEINLPFFAEFFPGSCNDEKAKLLVDMGLKGVWMGIQAGSERIRKEIYNRNTTNKEIMQQARIFEKHNISVRYDFIFDNPFESFEESLESIYMMFKFPEPFSMNIYSLKFFPNTEITTKAINEGVIDNNQIRDMIKMDYAYYSPTKNTKNIEQEFINRLAIYMALLANKGLAGKNKDVINDLINDFVINKNLSKIDKLIGRKKSGANNKKAINYNISFAEER